MKTEELKPTQQPELTEQPETLEPEKLPEENLENVTGGIFDRSHSKKFA
jgi:hypothetical protein